MKTYTFTLVLEPSELDTEQLADPIFEAGCDDALLGERNGVMYLEFDRDARSLEGALLSAIRAVESIDGVRVSHVEPDDLVTASEIARRMGQSREAVRLLAEGARGPGGFPAPVSGLTTRSARWQWVQVVRWLAAHDRLEDSDALAQAELIASLNHALRKRRGENTNPQAKALLEKLG